MTGRDDRRALALGIASLSAGFTAAALVLQAVWGPPDIMETLLVSSFAVLGLIVALRVPDNNLGWIFLAVGLLNSFATMWTSVLYVARDVWDIPWLAKTSAALSSWEWFSFIGLIATFALLLFPDGHLPSRRWRWVARVAAACIVVGSLALIAMTLADLELAVSDTDADVVGPLWLNILLVPTWLLLLACALASIASLVVRWRRATGTARQQLKWFMLGALIQLLGIASGFVSHPVATFIGEASILSLPATAVLAITRYRLYDIDRILSRTLTYAVLTALLLGLYLASVSALTAITAPVTGDSPLAVAAATLVAAAAFGPARRRIQGSVDRRFNRARYDAARMTESYRARLRDQLELDSIGGDLVRTARSAVQPRTVLLWLREGEVAP